LRIKCLLSIPSWNFYFIDCSSFDSHSASVCFSFLFLIIFASSSPSPPSSTSSSPSSFFFFFYKLAPLSSLAKQPPAVLLTSEVRYFNGEWNTGNFSISFSQTSDGVFLCGRV